MVFRARWGIGDNGWAASRRLRRTADFRASSASSTRNERFHRRVDGRRKDFSQSVRVCLSRRVRERYGLRTSSHEWEPFSSGESNDPEYPSTQGDHTTALATQTHESRGKIEESPSTEEEPNEFTSPKPRATRTIASRSWLSNHVT